MSARDEVLAKYELVVGVEVHAQLNTRTKLFCGCKLEFAAPPNSRTCPVCLGHPGVLPALNREAFAKVLRLAVAFGSTVEPATEFDRKNYYYPDLPKNYQISQMYHNVGTGGALVLLRSGRTVRMHNVHLEEDAGKLGHGEGGARTSSVDLNRAGTPLAEIVTMPDFRSIDEVDDYMDTLTELLRVLDVCNCQMQEGNLRFEASVSVRPRGQEAFGARTEIKNLNSYSAVRKAIAYEQARQVALLEAGKTPRQETRLWDDEGASDYEQGVPDALRVPRRDVWALLPPDWGETGWTRFMRSKEQAHDYRYFPEPDLPPLVVDPESIEAIRAALPELPAARERRFREAYALPAYDAEVLTATRAVADYFEAVARHAGDAKAASNWVMTEVLGWLNQRQCAIDAYPVAPRELARLLRLIADGTLSTTLGRRVLERVIETGRPPQRIVDEEGLAQIRDTRQLEAWAEEVLAAYPAEVERYRGGEAKLLSFFMGQLMKRSRGKADPRQATEILRGRLEA